MIDFVKQRDEAFVAFVRTGDRVKLGALCRRYGIAMPTDERALAGGVCKAVMNIRGLPQDVYGLALEKLADLGMSPEIGGYA